MRTQTRVRTQTRAPTWKVAGLLFVKDIVKCPSNMPSDYAVSCVRLTNADDCDQASFVASGKLWTNYFTSLVTQDNTCASSSTVELFVPAAGEHADQRLDFMSQTPSCNARHEDGLKIAMIF